MIEQTNIAELKGIGEKTQRLLRRSASRRSEI